MKKILIIMIILLTSASILADFGSGMHQGTRQEGMGGAFTGLADDGEAVVFNQAGLVNLKNFEAMLMYSSQMTGMDAQYGMDIDIGYVGVAHNFGDELGAVSMRWFYRSFRQDNEVFDASENIIYLGYGRKIYKNLSLGAGLSLMNSGFNDSDDNFDLRDWSYGLDISAFYSLNERISFGTLIKDINRPNRSIDDNTALDLIDYKIGGAWKYNPKNLKDVVTLDLVSENEYYMLKAGTEYWFDLKQEQYIKNIILRSGMQFSLESEYEQYNLSAGFGLDLDYGLRIDYTVKLSFNDMASDPLNHLVSVVYNLREPQHKPYIRIIKSTPARTIERPMKMLPVITEKKLSYRMEKIEVEEPVIILKKDEKITIDNIYFTSGKAELTINSYSSLDEAAKIFKDNPNIVIQVEGHTDSKGSSRYNLQLSQKRAEVVMNYVISKFGVSPKKIKAVGFGEDHPIATNNDEAGRKKNRRIEFKVISNKK